MCIDIAIGNRKPLGFLYKTDENAFIYSCSQCDEEFGNGNDLELHTIGHDVKEEIEIAVNSDLTLDFEPIEVYTPTFSPVDSVKDETIPLDSSTKEEMAIYLPFDTPKLEEFEKLAAKTSANESVESIDEEFPAFGFDNNTSSDDDSDDFFTSPTKKKTTKKGAKKRPKKNSFHCEICSRVFTSLARIKQHMIAGHIKKKKQAKRPQSPTLCTLCGKHIRDMKTHLKTIHSTERPFKCDHCDATFKQKVHRDTHNRQHTGEKPYVICDFLSNLLEFLINFMFFFISQICHLCGRSYHAQSVLNAHMNRYHLHLKPHKCDRCGNTYRQLYELRDHVNLHHLNQKMYPCEVCDRRFGTRKHLHQHMLSHGEKRFQCKFCDQKFATTSGRRGHEIRNHGAI